MPRIALSAPESADVQSARELGEALTIRETAKLIGCSTWLVRQKHIKSGGLPCFRPSGSRGRITFYKRQVVAWILNQQNGGI